MNGIEVVTTTGDPALAVDREGRILAWNPAAVRCLGFRRREVLGRRCWEVLQGTDPFANRYCGEACPMRDMARRGEPIHRCQLVFRAASGESLAVALSTLVVREGAGPEIVHLFLPVTTLDRNQAPRISPTRPASESRLSRRQLEVLLLLSDGAGVREIAGRLGIRPATARHHVQNLLGRLKVHSRLEAVSLARRIGLL